MFSSSEWTAEQVAGLVLVRSLVPNDQAHGAFEVYASSWSRKNACTEGRLWHCLKSTTSWRF